MNKKTHLYKRPLNKVHVQPKFLDENASNRTGFQDPKYIVIHEVSLGTGKSPENFNMQHYANKIAEAGQNGSTIGYHYLVGDKEIYQFLEDNVATHHTGTEFGNNNSIGVERLICENVNYEQATHNQAQLIATLMLKHNIPLDNVITHKEMQKRFGNPNQQQCPKQCPARVLAGFRGNLQDFKNEIKRCFEYGWFFNELLDEKTIQNIPNIQKEAQKRRHKEQSKQTTTLNNLTDLAYADFEI